MLEDMKEGILTRMDDQLTELRSSIPQIVQRMLPPPQLAQLPPMNPQYQPTMLPNTMLPQPMPQVQYPQFQASSY